MTSGTNNNLSGVWGISSSDVFAVGESGTILQYNGTVWSSMTSGTGNALLGVWGVSSSDVFAVGDELTIVQYNGTAWNSPPNGILLEDTLLRDIWGISSSDIFAVGSTFLVDGEYGTIQHYDGTAWSYMSGAGSALYGVWGSSSSDVFAVGESNTILHYNGTAWSYMSGGSMSNGPISFTWQDKKGLALWVWIAFGVGAVIVLVAAVLVGRATH